MKRRDLFKLAVPAAAVAVIPQLNADTPPISSQDAQSEMELYRGFRITWRGWFHANNQEGIVGRWIAYNPHLQEGWGMCVYSCYPGATSSFFADMLFDVSVRKNQEVPTADSSPEQLERFKQEAKDRLAKYIDEHYEELTDDPSKGAQTSSSQAW